eukprot:g1572.t1
MEEHPPQPPPAGGGEGGDGAADGGGGDEGFLDAGDVSYTPYRPAKVRIGKPHPDPVVENTTLAAVAPKDPTYQPHLPPQSLEQLSEVQMESIVYAGQQFAGPALRNSERRGFMIGDGAGVGKGRQLAGIILDAYMQGLKRHVWITISPDLLHDTKRDLKDIKATKKNKIDVFNVSDYSYNADLPCGDGVLFSTYKSLTMSKRVRGTHVSRLDQMIKWLGGGTAEGCILFDEAHKAKNLYHKAGATATGLRVKDFQDLCPRARVVYCSATPCSEPMNMGYMTRLGLWGEGTQFENFDAFLKDINARGVGAMELVAMQLKAEGFLLSRSLSFEGCTFNLVPLVNSKFQIDCYNEAVRAWQLLWDVLLNAVVEEELYTLKHTKKRKGEDEELCPRLLQRVVEDENGELVFEDYDPQDEVHDPDEILDNVGGILIKRMTYGMMKSMYWAAHQRFFRAMCIAFKVDKAVDITNKALADDKCVVIGLQSTGESNTKDAVKRGDPKVEEHEFLSNPAEIMKRLIIKFFWADEQEDFSDSEDEFSLEPSKKKIKIDKENKYPLGWKPPPSAEGTEALPKKEAIKASGGGGGGLSYHNSNTASPAAMVVLDTEGHQAVEEEEGHQVVEEEEAHQVFEGEVHQAAEEAGGAGSTSGPAPPERVVPTFTPEEDDLLYGEGDTKFRKAKSRLFAWLNRAHRMMLPVPPLDDLVDKLGGPNVVAEMTGRTERMVRADNGSVYLEKRDANNTAGLEDQNNFERAQFNKGEKRIAIISDAASAGVSLHANKIYPENKRRRVHITLELPWSADKAIQQLGRSHRANQFFPPEYSLIVSEVCGETRFSAAVAKRLESLGALTQGDRRASHAGAGELGFTSFNIDNAYGKASLNHIYRLCVSKNERPVVQPPDLDDEECEHIRDEEKRNWDYTNLSSGSWRQRSARRQKMRELEDGDVTFFEAVLVWLSKVDITVEDSEQEGALNSVVSGNVPRFLNRILGLRIVQQHVLFEYFHSVLEHHVKEAKREGTYEDGIRSLTGASCSVSVMKALDLPEKAGLSKGEVEAVRVTIDQSMPFSQIQPLYEHAMAETQRRRDLAIKMRAERLAAGNKVPQDRFVSYTGFYTKRGKTEVFLIVDYPGKVTSGFTTTKKPMTFWSPCRGRAEISYQAFFARKSSFQESNELEASQLWDVEMVRDKQERHFFALRGPRLLIAWPYLDEAFRHLYWNRPSTDGKKSKAVRSPVVHVKPLTPADGPQATSHGGQGPEPMLHDEYDSDKSDEEEAQETQKSDKDKAFIALQLPTTRHITESMAKQVFNVLENGTFANLRYGIQARGDSR